MKKLAVSGGTPVRTAPFPAWPLWDETERKGLLTALDSGKWGYPVWEFVPRFEQVFAAYHDAVYGICYNSGTSAIAGALWAAGVQPGDEVILPAYTFVATASAVVQLGAIPVFADIEPTSFNISARAVDDMVTSKTSAVIAVHIGGRPADMHRLNSICDYRKLALIEDAAQAWGAEWQGKRVGALGMGGAFSFQSSKNITAGEGGIVLTNDAEFETYCRSYCNCGRLPDKPRYEHFYIGGNYRLSELQGAVLCAQFERYPAMLRHRRENAHYLNEELVKIEGIVPVNEEESASSSAYHLYLLRYKSKYFSGRDKSAKKTSDKSASSEKDVSKSTLIKALQAEGIPAHPGYTLPLYKQPVFIERAFGGRGKQDSTVPDYGNIYLPETEKASSQEAIWLTQNVLMGTKKDMEDIIEAFHKIKENISELSAE